jgi:hypothetical protein
MLVVLLVAAWAAQGATTAAEGLLFRARDEVRDDSTGAAPPPGDSPPVAAPPTDNKSKSQRHPAYDCDDDDHDDESLEDALGALMVYGIGAVITSPWWGPHAMVDEGLGVPNYFPGHPYYAADAGYMLTSTSDWGDEFPATSATRFAFEYGHNLDQLQSVTGRLLWEHQSRFGVDGEIRYLQEEGAFLDDQLALGDLNFVYRFAQSDRLVMRSGLGINWLIDEHDAEAGFNFTYGGDLFPVKPLVISSEIDWGTLGDAEVFQWRGTVGAVWDHIEVYAGYRYYELEVVALDGIIAVLSTRY